MAKIATIERCLARIHVSFRDDPTTLEDINLQDVIVLNLVRACQAAIDLAMHVVARDRLGLPDDRASVFKLLLAARRIDAELCKRMENMVGFRNVAVHEYQKIDRNILLGILQGNLGDFSELCAAILDA
jgi:uncharacterized protein YutE (UPF0331/DUF86 family)